MKYRILLSMLVSWSISGAASAKVCHLQKLTSYKKTTDQSFFKLDRNTTLLLEGADPEHKAYEGPAWILANEKKICKINGGIFANIYFAASQNIIMAEEYSGSCGTNQMIDVTTCLPKGPSATYCGAVVFKENKLIIEPVCEPLGSDGKFASCSSGKVFTISDDCQIKLDEKESRALTKKKLGVELPLQDKTFKIKK